jgi:hypothetical protein
LGQRTLSIAQLPNLRVLKQRVSGSSSGMGESGIVKFGQPCKQVRRNNGARWVTRGVDLFSVHVQSLASAAETLQACTAPCATYGTLFVLAELQGELIIINTRDQRNKT